MRIRKHLRLSGLLLAADSTAAGDASRLPSRICRLNQSPWDVLDSSWSHLQENGEDSLAAAAHGGSFWNSSVVATDSVDDTKIFSDDELIDISVQQEEDDEDEEEEERVMCAKSYGNSWKCKSYAARSNSLCEHHLEKLQKSLAQPSSSTTTKRKHKKKKKEKTEKADTVTRESTRSRVRGRKTTMSTTNPYEFYYYSGFGPSWGKKRGAIATTTKTDEIVAGKENVYSSSETDKIDFSDEEEEESGGGKDKRRGRKRIKARSLKSLM